MLYNKKPAELSECIKHLEEKGLIINNPDAAKAYLKNNSLFRFKGYALAFRKRHEPEKNFLPGTTFEDVHKIARFDRELRILTFSRLERLETAVRSKIVAHMALRHSDAFWYLNPQLSYTGVSDNDGCAT